MIESTLPTSASRVAEALTRLSLESRIVEMPVTTRTAEEAARACGCAPAQIVKSLIFRGRTSGEPYLLLVSGKNRVDEGKVADILGEALTRHGFARLSRRGGPARGTGPGVRSQKRRAVRR